MKEFLKEVEQGLLSELEKSNPIKPKFKMKKSGGTNDWSGKTVNCTTGCINGCIYCYGCERAVRYKQVEPDQWIVPRVRLHDVAKKHKNYGELVMFPSSHDIFHQNFEACLIVIGILLAAGNTVLIVSKPRLDLIERICQYFGAYKNKIIFRFTIGAVDDQVLSFWEPGAPAYEERKACLIHAKNAGFTTSVSAEPMLDSDNIDLLINDLLPHVTETIWVGTLNHINRLRKMHPHLTDAFDMIESKQTSAHLTQIYNRWNNHPQLEWKHDFRKVVRI